MSRFEGDFEWILLHRRKLEVQPRRPAPYHPTTPETCSNLFTWGPPFSLSPSSSSLPIFGPPDLAPWTCVTATWSFSYVGSRQSHESGRNNKLQLTPCWIAPKNSEWLILVAVYWSQELLSQISGVSPGGCVCIPWEVAGNFFHHKNRYK